MGKGSKRRPSKIPQDEFDENWERVFGNKKPKTKKRHPKWHGMKESIE